jgi:hypothetical protein
MKSRHKADLKIHFAKLERLMKKHDRDIKKLLKKLRK